MAANLQGNKVAKERGELAGHQESKGPGGIDPGQPADQTMQEFVRSHKNQIEEKAGSKYDTFDAELVSTEMVAGTNYFVKINVGNEYIHARIHKDMSGNVTVQSVQTGKSAEDPLLYIK